jgi:selenoprotein W-related protein
LAAEIKRKHSYDSELIEGSGGVFKVWTDGELIWDKREVGRFPEEAEILDLIAGKKAS